MSLTKDIYYVQNVAISLGYVNEITAPAATIVRWEADLTQNGASKMSTIQFPTQLDTVKIFYGQNSLDQNIVGKIVLTGPASDVNLVLNDALYLNQLYNANLVEQVSTSQDRILPEDRRGEVQIQIPAGTTHGLNIGQRCRISSCNLDTTPNGEFVVTAIDSFNSPTRLWLIYVGGYDVTDLYYNANYKNAKIGDFLQTTAGVDIAPIIDLSYNNPHGYLSFPVRVFEDATDAQLDSGFLIPNGVFFIHEPYFMDMPPDVVYALDAGDWTTGLFMGAIAQQEENQETVQFLIKKYPNDPSGGGGSLQEQGDAIENAVEGGAPNYIQDNSAGVFSTVQVGDRISKSYDSGVVRWEFYGTPAECNEALQKVTYFRPPTVNTTYQIETRIVDGQTRIYFTRGA